jgi:ABC-type transport system involved in multi-copper enzyme maturation permease subunit
MLSIIRITLKSTIFRLEIFAVVVLGLVFIGLFSVFYLNDTLSGQVLSIVSSGGAPVSREIFLSTMFLAGEFFIVILALFMIPELIIGDRQQKILPLFLAQPIRRWEYFSGKYIGGTLALWASFFIFWIVIFACTAIKTSPLLFAILISAGFILLKLAILCAMIIALTEWFGRVFGSLVGLLLYIGAHSTIYIDEWALKTTGIWHFLAKTSSALLPNLIPVSSWSILTASLEHYPIEINYPIWFLKHIIVYIVGFVLLGTYSFKKSSL